MGKDDNAVAQYSTRTLVLTGIQGVLFWDGSLPAAVPGKVRNTLLPNEKPRDYAEAARPRDDRRW